MQTCESVRPEPSQLALHRIVSNPGVIFGISRSKALLLARLSYKCMDTQGLLLVGQFFQQRIVRAKTHHSVYHMRHRLPQRHKCYTLHPDNNLDTLRHMLFALVQQDTPDISDAPPHPYPQTRCENDQLGMQGMHGNFFRICIHNTCMSLLSMSGH